MIGYVLRRLAAAIPLLLVVPFVVFVMIDLIPGDPALILAGEHADAARIERIREQLNLGDPLLQRYLGWLGGVLQGDLGESFASNQPVSEMLTRRLGVTMSLVLVAMVMAIVIGASLAIAAVRRPGGIVDRLVRAYAALAIAMPTFWLGLLLVSTFAIQIAWFPSFGYSPLGEGVGEWLRHLFLPALALSVLASAEVALQLRSALLQTLGTDYVLNARARGLPSRVVFFKHALKNALVPVVTVLGFRVAEIMGGTVTIEFIYNMPGLGRLALDAVQGRDVPVLLGFVLLSTVVVVVANFLVDLSYGYLNPKVRS